jgi:hypothetical protein
MEHGGRRTLTRPGPSTTLCRPHHPHLSQGLGEMMPEQLWKTTMDPARRTLKRLTIGDAAAAAAAFSLLMGPLVGPPTLAITVDLSHLFRS